MTLTPQSIELVHNGIGVMALDRSFVTARRGSRRHRCGPSRIRRARREIGRLRHPRPPRPGRVDRAPPRPAGPWCGEPRRPRRPPPPRCRRRSTRTPHRPISPRPRLGDSTRAPGRSTRRNCGRASKGRPWVMESGEVMAMERATIGAYEIACGPRRAATTRTSAQALTQAGRGPPQTEVRPVTARRDTR